MKTTLHLNDALLTEAKAVAAQQRTSLTRLIEEGLQLRLHAGRAPTRPVRLGKLHQNVRALPGRQKFGCDGV